MTHEHGPRGHTHPHDNGHDHGHDHGPGHEAGHDRPLEPAVDLSIDDTDLSPAQLGRRGFLRAAGLLGAGAATATVLGGVTAGQAAAAPLAPTARPPKGVTDGWPAITTSTPSFPPTRSIESSIRSATPTPTALTGW